MNLSDLPEPMRARRADLDALPPIEKVRDMLHIYVEDADSFNEINQLMRRTTRRTTRRFQQYLEALETILSEPEPPGTLLRLVEWDANWNIDHDQTDNGAAAFLRQIAEMIRTVIREAQ
ncbi:hypothetical protein Aca07nite_77360 [Actinoplanes capillaceus]|uniref:Uncharacterized protein n=1 Tax=Actinoplanes campanulatus TaxID=113559 RepID=A0ABQ3WW04_9ACTN|nr:hypothetical protein [Actinoplanes capillaceus]GID50461.1 hypothetical protein Aca07nite_77360 [Actinoplanes capillaceus]